MSDNDTTAQLLTEELPTIRDHLDELSREAIPMLKRAIENMQAEGDDRGVANALIKTMPWLAEKCERITEAMSSTMPVELNITINSNNNHVDVLQAMKAEKERNCVQWQGVFMDAGEVGDLLSAYEDATGHPYAPRTPFKTLHEQWRKTGQLLPYVKRSTL
ncbi:hypothetical protein H5P92_004449 [Salmonella enterica]|nr:hypothetical protein [Salmonella enterica]